MSETKRSAAASRRASIAAWEPSLGAILTIADSGFDTLDDADGPLAGVAVGVKDIVDVAGLPTRNGSAACDGAAAATQDAPVVAALRAAGASVLCKTATTEFAFTDPAPTRNPHCADATPGGSSSGSGAAVGAGILDLAVGSQTAGSLCRPAAYCGTVAFKPSFAALSTEGMTPLAPSFDTLGFIARDVALAAAAWTACGGRIADWPRAPRIGRAPIDPDAPMADSALAALDAAGDALAHAGATVSPVPPSIDLAKVVGEHRVVMLAEAFQRHGDLLDRASSRLKPLFRRALEQGRATDPARLAAAKDYLVKAKAAFWRSAGDFDALLTPPTPGPAPHRDGGTGYQHLLTPWTVFGGPLLCVPWSTDAQGLPLSVMLASAPGSDDALLALAATLDASAPPRPVPSPPNPPSA